MLSTQAMKNCDFSFAKMALVFLPEWDTLIYYASYTELPLLEAQLSPPAGQHSILLQKHLA